MKSQISNKSFAKLYITREKVLDQMEVERLTRSVQAFEAKKRLNVRETAKELIKNSGRHFERSKFS